MLNGEAAALRISMAKKVVAATYNSPTFEFHRARTVTVANLKKQATAPAFKLEQIEVGGKVCAVYTRGDAARFRELGREFDKKFPRRARRASEESAVEAVRAIRDGRA